MREIKFRGKRIDNGEWVYGYYFYGFELGYNSESYNDVPPRCHYIFTDRGYFEVDPSTVGQYTGLNDKNGVEIYEGDICEVTRFDYNGQNTQEKCVVKFEDGAFIMFEQTKIGFYIALCDINDVACDVEVIGNIHDNPELLEVK